jgi:MFS family permease
MREIIAQPRFRIAAGTGVVAYSTMSFMMTAAPIAMIACGHSIGDAALGIQWHVLAMFGPSFFTGRLIARYGTVPMALLGLLLIAGAAIAGLTGLSVANFWIALILLGLGWNFAFVASTTMVAETHRPEEAAAVQGVNDFIVFGTVALSSLFAGAIIALAGWTVITISLLVVALGTAAALFSVRRSALASA